MKNFILPIVIALLLVGYVIFIAQKEGGMTETRISETDFCEILVSERGKTKEEVDTITDTALINSDIFQSKNEACAELLSADDVNTGKECEGFYEGITLIDLQKVCLGAYVGEKRAQEIMEAQYGDVIQKKKEYEEKYSNIAPQEKNKPVSKPAEEISLDLSTWETWVNKNEGFTISYPADFDRNERSIVYGTMNIGVYRSKLNQESYSNAKEYMDYMTQQYVTYKSEYEYGFDLIRLGEDITLYEHTASNPAGGPISRFIAFDEEYMYVVGMSKSVYEENPVLVRSIVSTFEILD